MIEATEVQKLIEDNMPGAKVIVEDPYNDKTHLRAIIISTDFEGQSRIAQHRMVYKALGDAFAGPLHALQITTQTPEEAEKNA